LAPGYLGPNADQFRKKVLFAGITAARLLAFS
jgi:hypothetical protein